MSKNWRKSLDKIEIVKVLINGWKLSLLFFKSLQSIKKETSWFLSFIRDKGETDPGVTLRNSNNLSGLPNESLSDDIIWGSVFKSIYWFSSKVIRKFLFFLSLKNKFFVKPPSKWFLNFCESSTVLRGGWEKIWNSNLNYCRLKK